MADKSISFVLEASGDEIVDELLKAARKLGAADDSQALDQVKKALGSVGSALTKQGKTIAGGASQQAASLASAGGSGAAWCTIPSLSCASPRGKFDLVLGAKGFQLVKSGGQAGGGPAALACAWADVECVARVPQPDPYKSDKAGNKQLVLVALKRAVPAGKGKASCFVVTCDAKKTLSAVLQSAASEPPSGAGSAPSGHAAEPSAEPFNGPEPETLGAVVASAAAQAGAKHVGRVGCVDPTVFTSSSGVSYVGAYKGVNDGHLWPLRQGMFFFKPPLFLPLEAISTMGVSSDPRRQRVEMTVETEVETEVNPDGADRQEEKGAASHEFGQIAKEDLVPLQQYAAFIAQHRRRAEKAEKASSAAVGAGATGAESEGSEEDEDFDPDDESGSDYDDEEEGSGSSEDEGSGSEGDEAEAKPAKAASKAAAKVSPGTGDETEDDERSGGEGGEGGESDDGSSSGSGSDSEAFEEESNPAMSDSEESGLSRAELQELKKAAALNKGGRSMRNKKRPAGSMQQGAGSRPEKVACGLSEGN